MAILTDHEENVEPYLIAQIHKMLKAIEPFIDAGRIPEAMKLLKIVNTLIGTLEERRLSQEE